MKGSITVALATGTLVAIAFGGIAMAAEAGDPSEQVVAVTAADAPEESGEVPSDDAASPGTPEAVHGLVCALVPAPVPTDATPGAEDAAESAAPAAEDIVCSGTGNERSAEVATVPRYLAHSDTLSGAERGAAISAWAKTHANKKSGGDGEAEAPEDGEAADAVDDGADDPAVPGTRGRSDEARGGAGSQPGNGRGR